MGDLVAAPAVPDRGGVWVRDDLYAQWWPRWDGESSVWRWALHRRCAGRWSSVRGAASSPGEAWRRLGGELAEHGQVMPQASAPVREAA